MPKTLFVDANRLEKTAFCDYYSRLKVKVHIHFVKV